MARRDEDPIVNALIKQNGDGFAKTFRTQHVSEIYKIPHIVEILKYAGKDEKEAKALAPYLSMVAKKIENEDMVRLNNPNGSTDPIKLLDDAGYIGLIVTNDEEQDCIAGFFRDKRAVLHEMTGGYNRTDKNELICTVHFHWERGEKRYNNFNVIHIINKKIAGDMFVPVYIKNEQTGETEYRYVLNKNRARNEDGSLKFPADAELPEEEWRIKPADPKQESLFDEYSQSVVSIQVKDGEIKCPQRYNHTLGNDADSGFNKNPDLIIPGLTEAIKHKFNVDFTVPEEAGFPIGYTLARDKIKVDGQTVPIDRIVRIERNVHGTYFGDGCYVLGGNLIEIDKKQQMLLPSDLVFNNVKGKRNVVSVAQDNDNLAKTLTHLLADEKGKTIAIEGKSVVVKTKGVKKTLFAINDANKGFSVLNLSEEVNDYINFTQNYGVRYLEKGGTFDFSGVKRLGAAEIDFGDANIKFNKNAAWLDLNHTKGLRGTHDFSGVKALDLHAATLEPGTDIKFNKNSKWLGLSQVKNLPTELDFSGVKSLDMYRNDIQGKNVKFNKNAKYINVHHTQGFKGTLDFSNVKRLNFAFTDLENVDKVIFNQNAAELDLSRVKNLRGTHNLSGVKKLEIDNTDLTNADIIFNPNADNLDLSGVGGLHGDYDFSHINNLSLRGCDLSNANIKFNKNAQFINLDRVTGLHGDIDFSHTKEVHLDGVDFSQVKRLKFNSKAPKLVLDGASVVVFDKKQSFKDVSNLSLYGADFANVAEIKFDKHAECIRLIDVKNLHGKLDFSDVKKLDMQNVDLSRVESIKFNPNAESVSLRSVTGLSGKKLRFNNVDNIALDKVDLDNATVRLNKNARKLNLWYVNNLHGAHDLSNVDVLSVVNTDLSGANVTFGSKYSNLKLMGVTGLHGSHDFSDTDILDMTGTDLTNADIKFNTNAKEISLSGVQGMHGAHDFSGVQSLNLNYVDLDKVSNIKFNAGIDTNTLENMEFFERAERRVVLNLGNVKNLRGTHDFRNITNLYLGDADICQAKLIMNELNLHGNSKLYGNLDFSGVEELDLSGADLSFVTSIKFNPTAKSVNLSHAKGLNVDVLDLSGVEKLKLVGTDLSNVKKIKFNPNAEIIDLEACRGLQGKHDFSGVKVLNMYSASPLDLSKVSLALPKYEDGYSANVRAVLTSQKVNSAYTLENYDTLYLEHLTLIPGGKINIQSCDILSLHDIKGLNKTNFSASNVNVLSMYDVDLANTFKFKNVFQTLEELTLQNVTGLRGTLDLRNARYVKLQDVDLSKVTKVLLKPGCTLDLTRVTGLTNQIDFNMPFSNLTVSGGTNIPNGVNFNVRDNMKIYPRQMLKLGKGTKFAANTSCENIDMSNIANPVFGEGFVDLHNVVGLTGVVDFENVTGTPELNSVDFSKVTGVKLNPSNRRQLVCKHCYGIKDLSMLKNAEFSGNLGLYDINLDQYPLYDIRDDGLRTISITGDQVHESSMVPGLRLAKLNHQSSRMSIFVPNSCKELVLSNLDLTGVKLHLPSHTSLELKNVVGLECKDGFYDYKRLILSGVVDVRNFEVSGNNIILGHNVKLIGDLNMTNQSALRFDLSNRTLDFTEGTICFIFPGSSLNLRSSKIKGHLDIGRLKTVDLTYADLSDATIDCNVPGDGKLYIGPMRDRPCMKVIVDDIKKAGIFDVSHSIDIECEYTDLLSKGKVLFNKRAKRIRLCGVGKLSGEYDFSHVKNLHLVYADFTDADIKFNKDADSIVLGADVKGLKGVLDFSNAKIVDLSNFNPGICDAVTEIKLGKDTEVKENWNLKTYFKRTANGFVRKTSLKEKFENATNKLKSFVKAKEKLKRLMSFDETAVDKSGQKE